MKNYQKLSGLSFENMKMDIDRKISYKIGVFFYIGISIYIIQNYNFLAYLAHITHWKLHITIRNNIWRQ